MRDEKGVETVRQASHLKPCDQKDKVITMLPNCDEYKQFGRNTKLLLHPKDITNLQFTSKTEERGEISPKVDISMVNVLTKYKDPSSIDFTAKYSEISPECSKQRSINDVGNEFITGPLEDVEKGGKISPEAEEKKEREQSTENQIWFQNPINCISRWSKALKMGVVQSMGLDLNHTAEMNLEESDKLGFSFFL